MLKMAAHNHIQKLENNEKAKALSLKHQVLCDQTAINGVLKQQDKATGAMQESIIKFGKEAQNQFNEQKQSENRMMMFLGGALPKMRMKKKKMKKSEAPMMMDTALLSSTSP